MKNTIIFSFILLLFNASSLAQVGSVLKVDREPFRRANMITFETTSLNAYEVVGKTLVSHNFAISDAYKEFGSIVTHYKYSTIYRWRCEVLVLENQVRIKGSYMSTIPLGNKSITSSLTGVYNSLEPFQIDYRNDLKDAYDEMWEIAKELKDKLNGEEVFHLEVSLYKD